MKKINVMKVLGFVVPLASAGLALVTNVLEEKKLDEKVAEKVSEALSNTVNKES